MVDNQGNFIPITGHTVISMLSPSYRFYGRMCAIEDLIENTPILRKYMKPTPSSSYHMTIYGIPAVTPPPGYNPSGVGSNHLETIDKLCVRKVIDDVDVKIRPRVDEGVYIGKTSGISFVVSKDTLELRHLLARKFIDAEDDNYIFHMTFAYSFRPIEKGDIDDYMDEITRLKKYIFDECITKNGIVTFLPPRVYSYNDMSSFTLLKDERA